MAVARIYRPTKTAMQSGRAKTHKWVLDYEQATQRHPDPLMGWISAGDTLNQLHLSFDTLEEAVAYAQKRGLDYVVAPPHERLDKPKAYADNFRYDRPRWSAG
ncbi:MAG TPA: ETC complex I subunit [Stellaceae bacterium]|nr:ETC complex I subunit [Stellaceae bacterium]